MSEVCAARIDNGIVTEVIVAEADWANNNLVGTWVQFVAGQPGKTYPAIGATYDEELDDFVNPEIVIPS